VYHAGFLSTLFGTSFAAQKSNHIYDMVREAFEVHDLIATLRNVARVSVLCKVTALAESPEQQARSKRMSDEYKTEVYSIRDRALTRLDQRMTEVEEVIPGAIQVKRPRGIRDRIGSDPFVGLEVDLEADEVDEEPVYWELEMDARKQFWLERYDDNIVVWYWDVRGVIDICETVSSEPFRTFSKLAFAHTCDAMFMLIISMKITNDRRVQRANVHARTLNAGKVTKADGKAYRKIIGQFNGKYNGDVDDGFLDAPAANVRTLSVLKVAPRSILAKNGFVVSTTELFAGAAERKFERENGQGGGGGF
jgi:hypothetical protein